MLTSPFPDGTGKTLVEAEGSRHTQSPEVPEDMIFES